MTISPDLWKLWTQAPCPEGMDPRVWADALRTRAERVRPWPHDVLDRLPRYMAGTTTQVLSTSKAEVDQSPTDQQAA